MLPTAELLEAQRLLNELQDLVDGRHPAVFGSFDVAFRDVVRKCREEFEPYRSHPVDAGKDGYIAGLV